MDVLYQGKSDGDEPPTLPDPPPPVARPAALWLPGCALAGLIVAASGLITQVRYTAVLYSGGDFNVTAGLIRRLIYSNLAVAGVALALGGWALGRRPRGETPWWAHLAVAAVIIALLLGGEGAVLLVLASHHPTQPPQFRGF